MGFRSDIYRDYRRYVVTDAEGKGSRGIVSQRLAAIVLSQGLWASCLYRLSARLLHGEAVGPLRYPLRVLLVLGAKLMEVVTGISLPPDCRIGPGLYIGHFGPTLLHPEVRIGANCNLSQGVSIAIAGRGARRGAPVLGDRVYVGPNAIVLGKITIGDDVAIGAGAVVTRSIPPRAVVVGNPAQTRSYAGSFDFVLYDGQADDPARLASMAQGSADPEPAAGG